MLRAASAGDEADEDIYSDKALAAGEAARPAKRQRLDSGHEAADSDPADPQSEDDEVLLLMNYKLPSHVRLSMLKG